MLEWTWGLLLLIAAFSCGVRMARDDDSLGYGVIGLLAAALALWVTWDVAGGILIQWVDARLPQQGTAIHTWTVLALGVAGSFFGAVAVVALPSEYLARRRLHARRSVA